MPPDVEIATLPPARVDDLRPLWLQLHAHHQSVAPELAPYLDDDQSWRARRVLYEETLGGEGFAFVARDGDGALVGYAMVAIHREEPNAWSDTWQVGQAVGEVETLLVVPAARGAGVGTRLLDAVDEELGRRGVVDLVIGVVPGNVEATRLYERRGLRPAFTYLTRFSGRSTP